MLQNAQPCTLAGLAQGLQYELRMFHATFASADQKEGMAAFAVSLLHARIPVYIIRIIMC